MSNKLKLNFLKRILIDSVENKNIMENFFASKDFPDTDTMYAVVNDNINPERKNGIDCPEKAHTMIGLLRLNNLHECLDTIREQNINGDVIETGVWRGGACIFMKKYLDLYNMNKKVFVVDSFNGLPKPEIPQDAGDKHHTNDYLRVSLEEVKKNFSLYNCLDENVIFLKGWFSDTLPNNTTINNLSLLRLDGDMYKSTMDVFESCYHKVSKNGFVIVDDYCLKGCFNATNDFRSNLKIKKEFTKIDSCGIFWQKD